MKRFLDTDHPMFRPLWVRILVVGFAGGWAVFEFVAGSPGWGLVFAALAGYAAWRFYQARSGGDGADRP
jgi:hypothetical protein